MEVAKTKGKVQGIEGLNEVLRQLDPWVLRAGRMVNKDEATWGRSEIAETGLVQPRLWEGRGRWRQRSTNKEASAEQGHAV